MSQTTLYMVWNGTLTDLFLVSYVLWLVFVLVYPVRPYENFSIWRRKGEGLTSFSDILGSMFIKIPTVGMRSEQWKTRVYQEFQKPVVSYSHNLGRRKQSGHIQHQDSSSSSIRTSIRTKR